MSREHVETEQTTLRNVEKELQHRYWMILFDDYFISNIRVASRILSFIIDHRQIRCVTELILLLNITCMTVNTLRKKDERQVSCVCQHYIARGFGNRLILATRLIVHYLSSRESPTKIIKTTIQRITRT